MQLSNELYWPTMQTIFRMWRQDQMTMLAYQYSTRILRMLVDQAQAGYEQAPRNGRTILCVCGGNESEDLAGQLCSDLLEASGYEIFFAAGGVANDELLSEIGQRRPDAVVVFAASASDAPKIRGLIVLDCIASGAMWVDMQACGIDVLVTAPQKGWSSSPCCAMVALSERARQAIDGTTSTSFACDLKKWLQIMETYESGGHAYHATMPTDALKRLCAVMLESQALGFDLLRLAQAELGSKVREMLSRHGIPSVAAPGFEAPGVVVSYTQDPEVQSSKKFLAQGLQTAAGVPLQCDEGSDFMTFRIGLFGLEKLLNVDRTVDLLEVGKEFGLDVREIHDIFEAYEYLTDDKLARPTPVAAPCTNVSPPVAPAPYSSRRRLSFNLKAPSTYRTLARNVL